MIALSGAAVAGALLPSPADAQGKSGAPKKTHSGDGGAWPARREKIERAWLDLLGAFPSEIPPLKPVVRKVAHENGITRHHVSFQTEPGDRVTAWLLVPDSAQGKKTPAIICIHSTTFGSGKDSVVGLAGRRPQDPPTDPRQGRAASLELSRHGYITLSIDLLGDGERVEPEGRVMDTRAFYKRHPGWSYVGKNTWDIMRSVDFLQTLDFVDHKQIGCTGWSLGGHTAVFAAAFEERITATVSNGGVLDWHRPSQHWARKPGSWEPWKKGDPQNNSVEAQRRFGFDAPTNSGPVIYIKKFRRYIDDPKLPVPVDFDELMMMVAPRPLLVISSEWEFYSHRLMPKCLETAKVYMNWVDAPGLPNVVRARQERASYDRTVAYYDFHHRIKPDKLAANLAAIGAGDCFGWFTFAGGHSFPPVARRHAFAWFDRWLGFEPDFDRA